MDNEQRLAAIHRVERTLNTLDHYTSELKGGLEAMERGAGAREVALGLTNLEQSVMWISRGLRVARDELRAAI